MKEMEGYKKLLAEAHREIDLLKKQKELTQRRIKFNTSVITGLDFPPLKQACRQMNLARSTYYYRLKHQKKTLEREKFEGLRNFHRCIETITPFYRGGFITGKDCIPPLSG